MLRVGATALVLGWTSLVILLGGGGPDLPRMLGAIVVCAVVGLGWTRGMGLPVAAGVGVVCTLAYALLVRPSHDRSWSEDQTRMPDVTWAGNRFTVHDLRRFRYRTVDDWDAAWTTDTFDLEQLVGADMGIERFSTIDAVAHTFVRFRFANGPALVASVEIRKERGETFSPLRGLFRHYEKMVVLADEADVIDLRVNHRRSEVVLHPLDLGIDRIEAFLRSILDEAATLHDHPVYYNTVLASCSSSLARHIRAVEPVPWDLRMVLPGYADALAHELGWLGDEDLEVLRRRHRLPVTDRPAPR